MLCLSLMDWFAFKKVVAVFLQPLMIFIELVVLGLVLVVFSRKRPRKSPTERWRLMKRRAGHLGIVLILLGVLALYVCSLRPLADSLTFALEKRYPPIDLENPDVQALDPDFIVVLAGGHRHNPSRPATSQLPARPNARMLEALRLKGHFERAKVVVTGRPNETAAMAMIAAFLGLGEVVIEDESMDTKDHPIYLKPILGESPFVLVTSAVHMPRAMALFEARGLDPIPGAADFVVWPVHEAAMVDSNPGNWVPRSQELVKTEAALHEYLGLLWAEWRGQL